MVPHVSEEGPVQVPPGPGHPSSIDIESTDFEDNLETGMLCTCNICTVDYV